MVKLDPEIHHRAVQQGAIGIVFKDQPAEILFKAIEKVYAGEAWFERTLVADVLTKYSRPRTVSADLDARKIATLTEREREIIAHIGAGYEIIADDRGKIQAGAEKLNPFPDQLIFSGKAVSFGEPCQVVADGGGPEMQERCQLLHAVAAGGQQTDNLQAVRVGKGLVEGEQLFGHGNQVSR